MRKKLPLSGKPGGKIGKRGTAMEAGAHLVIWAMTAGVEPRLWKRNRHKKWVNPRFPLHRPCLVRLCVCQSRLSLHRLQAHLQAILGHQETFLCRRLPLFQPVQAVC